MSAISITMQADRIIVLTDAAIYDSSNGNLLVLTPKCFAIPGVAGGVASRGNAMVPVAFGKCCEAENIRSCSWDDFCRVHLKQLLAAFEREMDHSQLFGEIVVFGWSATRQRGELFYWQNHGHKSEFKLRTLYRYWTASSSYHFPFGVCEGDLGDPAAFVPEVDGVRAFEAARQRSEDVSFGQSERPVIAHSVGGWVDETIIGASSVSYRRLHTWAEDAVGLPITPFVPTLQMAA